uniref:Uncharacterized protein n=1 Tax=Nonomuraea gerenzanensis TaxID=93944 RepID=A0A1M4EJ89_9ACTN|nr:hypothetical protein BN4615_P8274 [Nonomuraea gerenzanensis]
MEQALHRDDLLVLLDTAPGACRAGTIKVMTCTGALVDPIAQSQVASSLPM